MKNTLFLLCLLLIPVLTRADFPDEPITKSPRAGTDVGKQKFETGFVPEGGRLLSIEVNTGPKYDGTVVKGFRFIGETAAGKRVQTVVGPGVGKYGKPIELKKGVEVTGISGKHGAVIDSIRFHFSDGTMSPIAGGAGGSEEFKMLLRVKDGKPRGRVRGLFGLADDDSITGVGLMLLARNGLAPALEAPDRLELTLRGEVDAELAPIAGRLTALFYECYPALLERFDNPTNPAIRHVAVVFNHKMPVPAAAGGGEISVSIEWLKQHPQDIALLTHELTHIVQQYQGNPPGWMTEGIADYARHVYGPRKQPGWKLPTTLTTKQSYRDGYGTTARFLLWLEVKHPGVVDKLHRRLQTQEFAVSDFKEFTGKTVDELWAQCVATPARR